jgi:hypothetical protein
MIGKMAAFDDDLQRDRGDESLDPYGMHSPELIDQAMDGLGLHLKAIRRIRLLRSCEEQRIAGRAARGDPAAKRTPPG